MEMFTKGLRLFLKALYNILCAALVVLVLVMTVIMFLQIFMRATGMQSFKWSDEALRYLYIWSIFLGVPVAVYTNDHTRFDLIQSKLSPLMSRLLETLIILVMLLVLYYMCDGALTLVRVQMRQRMTSLPIRMGLVYLSMPICAIVSMLFLAAKLFLLWTNRPDLDGSTMAGSPVESLEGVQSK